MLGKATLFTLLHDYLKQKWFYVDKVKYLISLVPRKSMEYSFQSNIKPTTAKHIHEIMVSGSHEKEMLYEKPRSVKLGKYRDILMPFLSPALARTHPVVLSRELNSLVAPASSTTK